MSDVDLCTCGCGEPRCYPIGPTLEEAELMLLLLTKRIRQRHEAVAWQLKTKIEHAILNASAARGQ